MITNLLISINQMIFIKNAIFKIIVYNIWILIFKHILKLFTSVKNKYNKFNNIFLKPFQTS